jgi:5-methylcytosine-specific restriction endonuclease McrA
VGEGRGDGANRDVCALCGEIATTVDHIRPIWAGGTDDPANLRSLCADCHRDRHRNRRDVVDPRDLEPR